MTVQEQDIRDITDSVWTNVLRLEITRAPALDEQALERPVLTGCVQMSGTWEGAVTIQCSGRLARIAAASMFEMEPADTSPDEIRDALGELANIVGGNIKALLPGPTQLSLPIVVEGDRSALKFCDATAIETVWFESRGESFSVSVFAGSSARHHVGAAATQAEKGGGLP